MTERREHQLPRDPEDAFDAVLRNELRWQPGPDLTARLLALAAAPLAPPRPQPKRWYTNLVLVLTVMAMAVSFAVAWQFYGALTTELGLAGAWQQLQLALANGLQQVYATLPPLRYVIMLLDGVREQLHWLLLAVVLWLALDGWTPRLSLRRQTT